VLTTKPLPLELGLTYEGALVEGALLVGEAQEIKGTYIDQIDGTDIVTFGNPVVTPSGIRVLVRVNTQKLGTHVILGAVETDKGNCPLQLSIEIREGPPPGGSCLFVESPYKPWSSFLFLEGLRLMTRHLQVQVNAADYLPGDLSCYNTLIVSGIGLEALTKAQFVLDNYLEEGRRVIILADSFPQGSVGHANRLVQPYGIRIGAQDYGEIVCDNRYIGKHQVTKNVTILRMFRAVPVTTCAPAELLVINPNQPHEGFVACSGPSKNLYVIGISTLDRMVCTGWPFHNAQLFANLLI
jgi:hypothetical protein